MNVAKWTRALVLAMAAMALLAGCQAHQSGRLMVGGIARPSVEPEPDPRQYFRSMRRGGILVSIGGRTLHYWGPDGRSYAAYPIAVPRGPEFERYGSTSVVRKREQPDWRPTPAMRKRDPRLPAYIGPGPNNPMGEHAMYLGWKYYAIHGTNNPRSIGRQASSGCIRLFPSDIRDLFGKTTLGTPVRVVRNASHRI